MICLIDSFFLLWFLSGENHLLLCLQLGGRTIRVDHVEEYRQPKGDEKDEDGKFKPRPETGCAPILAPKPNFDESNSEEEETSRKKKSKKRKKNKTKRKYED